MIKMFSMGTCPDCTSLYAQVLNNPLYEVIDIGEHVLHLKEFLRLRDHHAVFEEARQKGYAGIPCFVLEDGTVTLSPKEAGLQNPENEAPACRLDGTGC